MTYPPFSNARAEPSGPRSGDHRACDALWGQPIFRPPPLSNPQVSLDPDLFRAVFHPERRRSSPGGPSAQAS